MKVIITGSTGMVGKGVLLECLDDPKITEVLVINRSSLDLTHEKLTEMRLSDFTQIGDHAHDLGKYDGCFFCMGVSSAGMSEEKYRKLTYDTAIAFAKALHQANPNMVFNYVSGAGTDSSENGRIMWARVKGKTENDILNMGFKGAYMFRPGMIIPERGIKSKTRLYQNIYVVMRPFFPLLRRMKSVVTTSMLGKAMIATLEVPKVGPVINPKEIRALGA
ncbi:MAG: epimerase [Flavobacteriia bacterium]|nr:epimerase [Flavobacteriia bacterium]